MKTTAKAMVLPAADNTAYRPVALVQERLARSRLLLELEKRHRAVLDAVTQALAPGASLTQSPIKELRTEREGDTQPLAPELAWFQLSHERQPLAWWGIDRCSLDQLASAYYGGSSPLLYTPLRAPSQSELRLVKRLMVGALNGLKALELDPAQLELEPVSTKLELSAPLRWSFQWQRDEPLPPMQWLLSDAMLARLTVAPQQAIPSDLSAKLKRKLHQLPIRLRCDLVKQSLPAQAIQDLQPGEILPVNLLHRSPISIGGRPLFHASVHTNNGQLVAKITQELHQQEDS
ncbi:FliM/FliN family flagellar motor switch protein [Ferrimonas pelagia]|uniref:Flagellar motor switch protein FliN-like C-terminal domain-containing protein n=1 Tax=Ferrimonas pelagia TaxID=1177826 RepID=A0ABP9EYE8_9GAMM